MAKKEINIFSISILDILSGALGAIIILYIILPRFNADTLEQVKELESLNATVVQVEQLEDMINQLKNTVEKELFEKIEAQIKELKKTVESLKKEIKTLQSNLAKAEKKIKEKEDKIAQLGKEIDDAKKQITQLKKQNDELKAYKIWMQNCGFDLNDVCPSKVDIGFKFQGKNILFIIDESGSMAAKNNSNNEDRIGFVKSGIKMLITTMGPEFNFDVIKFPGNCVDVNCKDYYLFTANWGYLKSATKFNKNNQYSFIKNLRAEGSTPTRAVLKYALSDYPGLSDIVILSDGQPTYYNTITNEWMEDDPDDILKEIKKLNRNNVRINAIGVGADFFDDPNSIKVQFMKKLTYQNGRGFFVDFY